MNSGSEGPTANHPGRRAFNQGVFDAGDRWILEFTALYRGELLDLGCGRRTHAAFFERFCSRYIGVDWSESMHGVSADVVANLNTPLPFADGAADTVISFSVLEHLCEPTRFLEECCRLLRPNGWLVLQVPFMWHVHEAPHDYFRFTRHGLAHLLSRAGFVDVRIEATTGFWLMWATKFNYQLARFIRGPSLLRLLSSAFLWPVFKLSSIAAIALDRVWPPTEIETAGYFAVARKPCP
jgi:SAM-dependent methyltransferase